MQQFLSSYRFILAVVLLSRTKIQGVQGGHFSSYYSKSLFFSYFDISEYQIGTPCSYVYLVQFLPFINIGSPLGGICKLTNLSHTKT